MTVYRVLATNLQGTADAAIKYMASELGLSASSVKVEAEIHPAVDFRPTLQAITAEKQILCIEVLDSLYPPELNSFVLSCRNHSIPAKLYCAFPTGTVTQVDTKALQFASENGIGILEINPANGHGKLLNQPPVALSLGGLRKFDLSKYQAKLRPSLKMAVDTFRAGNPAKGCSQVYDELEQLTRRIGAKCERIPGALKKTGALDWERASWHSVLDFMKSHLDPVAANCPLLKGQLLNRLIGMTEFRNETGHKPTSVRKMIARDIALKTRFESAMDELATLAEAARPLKV
jgi:hypothetical protein